MKKQTNNDRWSGCVRTARPKAANTFKRVRDDESGAAVIFALSILVLMLLVTGMAVDMVRAEAMRVRIQQTADRAVLAAADLDQTLDAKHVVEDYFEKAGLEDALTKVTVTEGLNFKRVRAETDTKVPTFFLHMVGMDHLNAVGVGEAEEQVSDIEISLVVDVSGSMGSNNRLKNLKNAAKDFFRMVADDQRAETGVTSISIIPYNATVNAGSDLLSYFKTTSWHKRSHCIRFRDADFKNHQIKRTQLLERVGDFAEGSGNYKSPSDSRRWCRNEPHHEILPYETRIAELDAHINGLKAKGWTAVDAGIKWGAALLDPDLRGITNDMIQRNLRQNIIKDWPLNFGEENAMKVIVLMTDGANTVQRDLKDEFKRDSADPSKPAMSDVYFSASKGKRRRRDGYYVKVPNRSGYQKKWVQILKESKKSDDRWFWDSQIPSDLKRLSYQDLLEHYYIRDAANYFLAHHPWHERNAFYNGHVQHDSYSQADARARDICDEIKKKKVIIFSIAFEAPTAGKNLMKYCASTDGHYYEVAGGDISYAFRSIASQINHLRLIQ